MDPEEGESQDEGTESGAEGASAPAPTSLALTPEQIRNSPEFKTLAKENRSLNRKLGDASSREATARAEAETARQAAEAQQQAALEADITGILGPQGLAAWTEIAELSATDQRAAAQRLADLMANASAQNAAATTGEGEPDPADAGGTQVPANTPPPPPGRGVDGGAPLQAQQQDAPEQVIAALEKAYNDTVEMVQTPSRRNRVTERVRANAFISYLAAGYLKAGATPKTPRA